jgi:hypothetical protein
MVSASFLGFDANTTLVVVVANTLSPFCGVSQDGYMCGPRMLHCFLVSDLSDLSAT